MLEPEEHDQRSPTERFLEGRGGRAAAGKPLSEHARQYQRTLEGYLRSGDPPRWMLRLKEIERGTAEHVHRLEEAYRALQHEGLDRATFAARWHEIAERWSFAEINETIDQHNDWYPIERQLPMSPRTGDFLPVMGRSYRRTPLSADWILERFPAQARLHAVPDEPVRDVRCSTR